MTIKKRQTMMEFQQGLIDSGQITTCTNCINWKERPMSGKTMICGKWDQTPPPDVIVVGCNQWEFDIPF